MGFSNYFLVVYDFIRYAKKNKILVGPTSCTNPYKLWNIVA